MSQGKCPKCDKIITNVNLGNVFASVPGGTKWKAISYLCPFCSVILSVQIDPIAIKTDTLKALGK